MPVARTLALAAVCFLTLAGAPVAAQTRADPPFWTGQPDSAGFAARTAERIAAPGGPGIASSP